MKDKKVFKLDLNNPEHQLIVDMFWEMKGIKSTITTLAKNYSYSENRVWKRVKKEFGLDGDWYSFNFKENSIQEREKDEE